MKSLSNHWTFYNIYKLFYKVKKIYRIFTFHFFCFESAENQLFSVIPNLHIREKLKFVILDSLPKNVTLPNVMQVSPKVVPSIYFCENGNR